MSFQTAYQPDAFQNNAFQIYTDIPPTRRPIGIIKKLYPTINGRIEEYEKKHIEEIKALLLIYANAETSSSLVKQIISIELKHKNDIDIEELLLMVMLDE